MRKKESILLLCTLLVMGCNHPNTKQRDILHPNFNLTVKTLMKDGFYHIPEDVFILGKQINDTLLYYQFDDDANKKSKPAYMFCKFPISSTNADSVENFLYGRDFFRLCEYKNNDFLDCFYVKHQYKGYIFSCTINKVDNTLTLSYFYPQID